MKPIHLASLSTSLTPKITLLGVMGGLAIVVLSVGTADAAILNLSIENGGFTDNTSFSGTFSYDTNSNTYSNWNITTVTGPTVSGFNYTTVNSFSPRTGLTPNSPQSFSIESNTNNRIFSLDFNTPLASLTTINPTSNLTPGGFKEIILGTPPLFRGINSGSVRVNNITTTPEPTTLLGLGSVAALGFFGRKKKSKSN